MKMWVTVLFVFLLSMSLILAADAKAGEAAYLKACKSCHGADGEPVAKVAAMMKVEMKALSSKEIQAMSDADIKKVIMEGKRKMKPVKAVTDKEAGDIIAHVRTLKK